MFLKTGSVQFGKKVDFLSLPIFVHIKITTFMKKISKYKIKFIQCRQKKKILYIAIENLHKRYYWTKLDNTTISALQ